MKRFGRISVLAALSALLLPALAALSLAFSDQAAASQSFRWKITKERWSPSEERAFGAFVTALAEADCQTIDACLKHPANPYRHSDPGTVWLADCADLPYLLRAYFAWKNGLPFSYQSAMAAKDGPGTDIRLSVDGNTVAGRTDVPARAQGVDAVRVLAEIRSAVSTGMYRHHAADDGAPFFTDLYSPVLDRGAIRPGTVVYDVNGHVALVYRVEDDGRILTFSSHPDRTLSRSFFGRHFLRADPKFGAGFKNWRPIELVGARRAANGVLVGGRVEGLSNEAIGDFSLMQYEGNGARPASDFRTAAFTHDGELLDYYHWLRAVMAKGDLRYDPVAEMRHLGRALCEDLKARAHAVELAVANGTDRRKPPSRHPDNIYGTFGIWEIYSTPSRDARLKTKFIEARKHAEMLIERHRAGSPKIAYDGEALVAEMAEAWRTEAESCAITYRNSAGELVRLTMAEIEKRLFALSFDPYHCIERRWGASGRELRSCGDGALKVRWYAAQQPLRNQVERTYEAFMGHSLAALEHGPFGVHTGKGVSMAPEADVSAYFAGYEGAPFLLAASPRRDLAEPVHKEQRPAEPVLADPGPAEPGLAEAPPQRRLAGLSPRRTAADAVAVPVQPRPRRAREYRLFD